MAADALATLYALLGGFFMGSYPVPIKTPAVLEAQVHPVVFQCYKSFWTFVTGWLFVFGNAVRGRDLIFEFTWWGVLSAALWVPAGFCTIAAVPMVGVGMTVVVTTGMGAALSFLVFWLVLGERMRAHGPPDTQYFLAPFYLFGIILGMAVLVASPYVRKPCMQAAGASMPAKTIGKHSEEDEDNCKEYGKHPVEEKGVLVQERVDVICESGDDAGVAKEQNAASSCGHQSPVLGIFLSSLVGVLSAGMYGAISIGKRAVEHSKSCTDNECSAVMKEQFNPFGSWMASFGTGAAAVTVASYACTTLHRRLQGKPALSLQLPLLCIPGSIAGLCWTVGAFFQTAAVARGGNAVMLPVAYSMHLITSGAWGLLYYREVHGCHRIALWTTAALWTLIMTVLLSQEKQGQS